MVDIKQDSNRTKALWRPTPSLENEVQCNCGHEDQTMPHISECPLRKFDGCIIDVQNGYRCSLIAVDIDPVKIKCARRNAEIYGVLNKIDFICADFFSLIPHLAVDVLFLSPPWGGPAYLNQEVYDTCYLMGIGLKTIFRFAQQFTSNIAIFLPRNASIIQLTELEKNGDYVEVEQNILNNKLKTVTAYYGDLVCDFSENVCE
ncbi:unnamed protein product [Soboliphyme baturini]|uniref:Trimethylguanosine synthase n=1 Tax=Soboliphyme baturini TaxID=241478 RepID=A0A183J516_9BILA|nr:unnamed protein product [Soboliphyme baturini]